MEADTLDQIREHLAAIRNELTNPNTGNPNMLAPDAHQHAVAAISNIDALLAEGCTERRGPPRGGYTVLVIPLQQVPKTG